jgi:hypothetical protein
MVDEEMASAFREAASELGIRVLAPHTVELEDGTSLMVEAFLADFGGPNGTLAIALGDRDRYRLASMSDAFVSQLGQSYRRFDAALFRDTLDDWGWFGSSDDRPAWYTGKSWG